MCVQRTKELQSKRGVPDLPLLLDRGERRPRLDQVLPHIGGLHLLQIGGLPSGRAARAAVDHHMVERLAAAAGQVIHPSQEAPG